MAFQVPDTVAKPMPPEPDGFVAYIAAELMKQDLDIPKRQPEPDAQHHHQTNDVGGRRIEVAKRTAFCHANTLTSALPRLKASCSDKTFPA